MTVQYIFSLYISLLLATLPFFRKVQPHKKPAAPILRVFSISGDGPS